MPESGLWDPSYEPAPQPKRERNRFTSTPLDRTYSMTEAFDAAMVSGRRETPEYSINAMMLAEQMSDGLPTGFDNDNRALPANVGSRLDYMPKQEAEEYLRAHMEIVIIFIK